MPCVWSRTQYKNITLWDAFTKIKSHWNNQNMESIHSPCKSKTFRVQRPKRSKQFLVCKNNNLNPQISMSKLHNRGRFYHCILYICYICSTITQIYLLQQRHHCSKSIYFTIKTHDECDIKLGILLVYSLEIIYLGGFPSNRLRPSICIWTLTKSVGLAKNWPAAPATSPPIDAFL